jgi:hypothetical protein
MKLKEMSDAELTTVRDNTPVLLGILLAVFITMVLLSVSLVRLGNLSRKIDNLAPSLGGGGVRYFYMT